MTMHGQLPKAAQAHAEKLRTPSASSDTPTKALSESTVFLLAVPARAVGPSREALEVIERIDAVPAPAPVINTTNEPLPQFRQARLGTLTPHHSLPFRPGSQPELLPTEPPPPPKPIPKPSLAKGKRYWRLSATDPLSTALRQTTIIEWPEIEVWERTAYESALRLGYIEIVQRGPVDSSSLPLPRAPAAVSQEGLTSLQAYEDSSGGEEGEVIGGGNVMGSLVGLLPVT